MKQSIKSDTKKLRHKVEKIGLNRKKDQSKYDKCQK